MSANRTRLTLPRIAEFTCPPDKSQAFLWDTSAKGLAVRCTPATNRKTFVFETRIKGKTARMTIGHTSVWTIDAAREEARRLQRLIDVGKDPRVEKAILQESHRALRAEARSCAIGADVWREFIESQTEWSQRRHTHAARMTQNQPGRVVGPLVPVLAKRLKDITADDIVRMFEANNDERPMVMGHAYNFWRQFYKWCEAHEAYRGQISPEACQPKIKRKYAKKQKGKTDCLQREQLAAFFKALQIEDEKAEAALVGLLVTGARKNELLNLTWADVDFRWLTLEINDKTNGRRTIPLTPYFACLLAELPRVNDWVFPGRAHGTDRMSETTPNSTLRRSLARAQIPHVSVHGLRRSFGSLAEWVEVPAGVVAQIMGHAPNAIAEKHYRVRPMDLLRKWHNKIEEWMLEQAGIEFDANQALQKIPERAGLAPTKPTKPEGGE